MMKLFRHFSGAYENQKQTAVQFSPKSPPSRSRPRNTAADVQAISDSKCECVVRAHISLF